MCQRSNWTPSWFYAFFLAATCFLFIVYNLFPSLFIVILNSLPVIVCTTILLGILLVYGEPNLPENEKDFDTIHTSSYKNEDNLKIRAYAASRKATKRLAVRTTDMGDRNLSAACIAVEQNDVNQLDAASADSHSSFDENANDNKNLNEEKCNTVDADISEQTKLDNGYDSCSSSQWYDADSPNDASSDSESIEEVISDSSVPDEVDPLLDMQSPHPYRTADRNSCVDSLTDYFSTQEEEEIEDDEDNEEGQEEKDDTDKVGVTWTADDQRILMELRNTELERNRRLENIIVTRKARVLIERNLIDLDDNAEDSLKPHNHISSVTAQRWNPFDLPYDSDEPDSAPSVLLPRRNPFDLPCDQILVEENFNHRKFTSVHQSDVLFRRHESFTTGATLFSDLRQDWGAAWFNPGFVEENNVPRGSNSTEMNEKSSETSRLKAYSTSKSQLIENEIEQTHQTTKNIEAVEDDMSEESSLSTSSNSCSENYEMRNQHEHSSSYPCEAEKRKIEARNGGYLRRLTATKRSVSPDAYAGYEETHYVLGATYDMSEESSLSSSSNSCSESYEMKNRHELCSSYPSESEKSKIEIRNGGYLRRLTATKRSVSPDADAGYEEAHHVVGAAYDFGPATKNSVTNNSAERGISSSGDREETVPSGDGFHWFAPPNLASVDENESVSREIPVIRELDVIGNELYRVREDFGGPVLRIMSSPTVRERLLRSSASSMDNESNEDR